MRPRRLGLMGLGVIGLGRHLPAILETEGFELHAVLEPDEARRRLAAEDLGVPHAVADAEAFFDSGIEVVSVVSPAPAHEAGVLAAAKRRLPVLCEKPLAPDGDGARRMVAAMADAGAPLFAAFCYRFSPSALLIRDLVREGAIGEVRSLRLVYIWGAKGKYQRGADGRPVVDRWRDARMREGGPLVDCGTHQIDLARFWLGSEVVRQSGAGAWVDEYEAPDHVWLHMDHACGAHTTVEVSYSYHHTTRERRSEFVYELIGTKGVIRYDRGARSLTLADGAGTRDLPFHREKNFAGMYAELARFLETGESFLLGTAEDGVRAIEIARSATDEAMRRRGTASSLRDSRRS
jgi:predicted dehydrogenase